MPETAAPPLVRFRNGLLKRLSTASVQRLQLRKISLPKGREIEFPGSTIGNLFFLETGVAVMTTTFEDGSQVEVGLFGRETVLGVSALMGTKRSLNRVYMLMKGHGFAAPMAAARREFLRGGGFQGIVCRTVQAGWTQAAQAAGCNARHDVQQRLARALLLCADRAQSRTLQVSHDSLGTLLGVRRMSAGDAVATFRDLGLLEHRPGVIKILDLKGLESHACECYRTVRRHLDNCLEFDNGHLSRYAFADLGDGLRRNLISGTRTH